MISSATLHIIQQYQQIAAPLTPGHTTDMQEKAGLPVQPVQPTEENIAVSEEARKLAQEYQNSSSDENEASSEDAEQQSSSVQSSEYTQNDEAVILKLQSRDRAVRAHEQAHLAAAGQYARSGASFTYQRGPDGKIYAVGGEVSIDISRENTPEITLAKMQTVRRAALAPADPSSTDRQVAAQATARMNQARQEIQQVRMEELVAKLDENSDGDETNPEKPSIEQQNRQQGIDSVQLAEDYKPINEYI